MERVEGVMGPERAVTGTAVLDPEKKLFPCSECDFMTQDLGELGTHLEGHREVLLASHLHRSAFASPLYTIQCGAPGVALFASVLESLRQAKQADALVQFDQFMEEIRPRQWRKP